MMTAHLKKTSFLAEVYLFFGKGVITFIKELFNMNKLILKMSYTPLESLLYTF